MDVKEIAFQRVLSMLNSLKCNYVIVKEDGQTITQGNLKLAEPEPEKKRRARVPVFTYRNVYLPYLEKLNPGDVVTIPYGTLDPEGLQSATSAWCSTNWGKGASVTHRNDIGLEVLRVA